MKFALSTAWDLRVARLLCLLPLWLRAVIDWLRVPARAPVRIGAACLFIFGGVFSILPVFGLWMLPLGLALLADDVPRLKPTLERTAMRVEMLWQRLRGRTP